MKNIFLTLIFANMLVSCAFSVPKDNVDFVELHDIKELEGVYENYGETGENFSSVYLSKLIWPASDEIQHATIKTIKVIKVDQNKIKVIAFGEENPIIDSTFQEGKDFELVSDGINIKQQIAPSLAYPPGNPFIGLGYISIKLGIDEKGDGKYRSHTSMGGVAFLVIPIAVSGYDDVRFRKIGFAK